MKLLLSISLLVLPLLFLTGGISANGDTAYEDIEEATLAPDSPFYFLRNWQEGIERFITNFRGDEATADLELRHAERRVAEMRRLTRLGENGERLEQLRERWAEHLERAGERAERATENREAIRERILEQMDRHRTVFERVRDRASDEAREALDRAIENYETRRSNLLERFSEEELDGVREHLRERLDETIEHEELQRDRFRDLLESRTEETDRSR